MPKFVIEQYELHLSVHEIEADSCAAAIKRLLEKPALGDNGDDVSRFLEVAEQYGLSTADNQELAEQLRHLGVPVQDIVPGIRQVYRLREV